MVSIFLVIHIIGSLGVLALIFGSVVVMLKSVSNTYQLFAKYLGLVTLFQMVSGSLLMLASGNGMSLAGFCSRVALYMGVILITQAALYMKMRNQNEYQFPAQSFAASFAVSMSVVLVTVVLSI